MEQRSADSYHQLLAVGRDLSERNWRFEAWHGLGRLHHAAGAPETALSYYRLALELATELEQPGDQARVHDGLANTHHALGQLEPARQHWQQALNILTGFGLEHTELREASTDTINAHLAALSQAGEENRR